MSAKSIDPPVILSDCRRSTWSPVADGLSSSNNATAGAASRPRRLKVVITVALLAGLVSDVRGAAFAMVNEARENRNRSGA